MSTHAGAREPVVRLERVDRSFGARRVLHDVSLRVEPGQVVALLGPSGAGKTTLVKLVAGVDRATSGEVFVYGARMPRLSALSRIGYMAQSDALYTELSARENMEFFAALYGMHGRTCSERIEALGRMTGLSPDLERPVSQFSGGMKRRVSLAIAMLHEPELLILDEPTVGIDPVLRNVIWEELRGFLAGGGSVLVTTHVMDEAERCDRVCMIREGALIADDTPTAIKKRFCVDRLEQAFLRIATGENGAPADRPPLAPGPANGGAA